jgi:PEP-CTERM motif-containing protein
MERTNYVDRAKRIMTQSVRTGALVIVPLAAAVQLHATPSTTLPTGSPTCTQVIRGTTSSPCGDATPDTVEATGLPGAVLTGVQFSFQAGENTLAGPSGGSWNSTWTVTFSTGGSLSGPLTSGEIIPLNYTMNLSDDGTGWNLQFELGTSGNPAQYGSQTFSGSQSGSGSLTGANPGVNDGSPLVETVLPSITGIPTDFIDDTPFFQLFSPEFDFGPLQAPEPASVGLFASGLAFLGWMFRRRSRVR